MDILVLVVVAVVYALGAVIKAAKGKKTEEQKIREQQTGKTKRKPPTGGRGLLEQFITEIKQVAEEARSGNETRPSHQTAAQKKAQAQAVLQKYTAKAQQEGPVQPKIVSAQPEVSKPAAQVQPGLEKLREIDKGVQTLPDISSILTGLSDKDTVSPDEYIEPMHLSEVLADYEDPEELKRAILHYEILGRPLALRDPSADIIGL